MQISPNHLNILVAILSASIEISSYSSESEESTNIYARDQLSRYRKCFIKKLTRLYHEDH